MGNETAQVLKLILISSGLSGILLFRFKLQGYYLLSVYNTLVQKVFFAPEVCGRIRNFMESNGKLSKHFKSSLLYAHMVLSCCVDSITKQLDLQFNLMISRNENQFQLSG